MNLRRILSALFLSLFALVLGASAAPVAHAQAQNGGFSGPVGSVVIAQSLNARTTPSTAAGVIAVLPRGASYSVSGRLGDNSWYQIRLLPSNLIAWVSGAYFNVIGLDQVPVLATTGPVPATGSTAVVTTSFLNVRHIPDPFVGQIRITTAFGSVYPVVGKSSGSPTWYEIVLTDGSRGWINGNFANITNAAGVPVTYQGGGTNPVTTSGHVTSYFLNVRTEPNPFVNTNIITMIARNQSFTVVGKNASGTWWQIVLPSGARGWVRGKYFFVANGAGVPVTFNN